MLNGEKFKNELENLRDRSQICFIAQAKLGLRCDMGYCFKCEKRAIDWLLEDYKDPILDDIEREYLSAVIKPFRKRIKSIKKTDYPSNSAFISIAMDKCEHIFLPVFELNSGMYQRMEINKEYTLEELGL